MGEIELTAEEANDNIGESNEGIVNQNVHEERLISFFASNRTCLMYCFFIGMFALILGLGLGLGLEGKSSGMSDADLLTDENAKKARIFMDDLAKKISPPETLSKYDDAMIPLSYQTEALDWMTKKDLFTLREINNETPDNEILLQRYAIVALYFATKGKAWSKQFNFLSSDHVCNWNGGTSFKLTETIIFPKRGIICDQSNRISSFAVPRNNLDGTIPDEIYYISSFKAVDIGWNKLKGQISEKMSQWQELTIYAADNNLLSGLLHQTVSSLINLEYFNIFNNYYDGPVTNQFENMPNLAILNIGNNFFTGDFPNVEPLSKLTNLNLELNGHFFNSTGFTGEIPTYLGVMEQLKLLDLSNNNFTGRIPTQIGQMANLKLFDIHANEISGGVPSELINIDLDYLILHSNKLSGDISEVCDDVNLHMTADCLPKTDGATNDVECDCCFLCCDDTKCCTSPESEPVSCYLIDNLAFFYR